eukprot:TRINITY_DN8804_c0_g1_i1.p1 TRINITY_DN8804_c0_g1~~TRINITY_DN8804_c0_g1_i1.p1  ORF type:complete len:334 (-),score=136.66 TRINITY_DN8804_c0_g1_i1:96-1097(-)
MAFSRLFGAKPKDPAALVRSTRECLTVLERSATKNERNNEELNKNILGIKIMMYGDVENEPNVELNQLVVNEIVQQDLLPLIVTTLQKLDFETRKDIILIFGKALRTTINERSVIVEYICRTPDILTNLVLGYESVEISLNCGAILRECVRQQALTKILLNTPIVYNLFAYVESPNFDIGSDAFLTLKELLTRHKLLSAEFLEKNYDRVFELYTGLLNSINYVTKRQSLKLLGELLLDKPNYNVMTRYISDANNLKLTMILLRDRSKPIQYEAFHVFKVFVANPNKTPTVLNILLKNKQRLVDFLTNFQNDNEEDQFTEEKSYLLKTISSLGE